MTINEILAKINEARLITSRAGKDPITLAEMIAVDAVLLDLQERLLDDGITN